MTKGLARVENAFWRACDHLLMQATNPWELDDALKEHGFVTGPCEAQDHIGLVHILRRAGAHSSPILPRMVGEGRHGKISGVGFYRYPGGGGAVVDPLIEDLILEEAHFAKVTRSDMSDGALADFALQAIRDAVKHEGADMHLVEQRLFLGTGTFGAYFSE